MPATKCQCGCGQAPAATTRLRKASCSCGESIIRLSRSALAIVTARCSACGSELAPDCLFDRTSAPGAHAEDAIATLEARYDDGLARRAPKSPGRRAPMFRCGDCQAIRSARAKHAALSAGRPRPTCTRGRGRVAGGDMPF